MSNTFYEYVKNALSQLDVAISIENQLLRKQQFLSDPRDLEFIKVSHLARASESFVKALLLIYALIFVLPISFIALKENVNVKQEYEELEFELRNLVKDYTNKEKLMRKISHYPASKSHLPIVMKKAADLLRRIGAKEPAKAYEKISKILLNESISYDTVKETRVFISKTTFLKEIYSNLLLKNPEMKDQYEIDIAFSMADLGIQALLDFLLYTKYLEIASVKGQYPASLSEKEENQLYEIVEHQKEIMDNIKTLGKALKILLENEEFLERVKEFEEAVKYFLETKD
ncbi:hypothetical protein [Acidianus sp. RZ1]|uniref:hypothetical protein n=1 Tax=Acidianus sp. RZ1 TaxID=1540082 RepID=UPI001492A115|nr:hypothetical protein [Acidianus sp. RZ1]NON63154.1 hypothetical protein [Acidianus sp. RZ1]